MVPDEIPEQKFETGDKVLAESWSDSNGRPGTVVYCQWQTGVGVWAYTLLRPSGAYYSDWYREDELKHRHSLLVRVAAL